MSLATDQFMAFFDWSNAFHGLRESCQKAFEAGMGGFIADGSDNSAGHAAHDVWSVAEVTDLLEDIPFFTLGDARFKHDDHGVFVWPKSVRNKPQAPGAAQKH